MSEVELRFPLKAEADDWPPFAVESVWCETLDKKEYRVVNVPFFFKELSHGDVIGCRAESEKLWFDLILEKSGNSTIQIFCLDSKKRNSLLRWSRKNNCVLEVAYGGRYIVISIPPEVELGEWSMKLKKLESAEGNEFEYEIVSMRHRGA